MTKATMKSLLMTAAMSGLLTGATTTVSAATITNNSGANQHHAAPWACLPRPASTNHKTEKHACKGQNSCKGKGGCKSGDNGCKGQELLQGQGRMRHRRLQEGGLEQRSTAHAGTGVARSS